MNKFIEKIVVPKSFLNVRDCAPVGRDATATAMARLEKDMSGEYIKGKASLDFHQYDERDRP